MFGGSEGECAVFGARPIHHADVLVSWGDSVDVKKTGGDEGAGAGFGGGRALAEQFDFQAAFLARLAQGGCFRVFVQFNVSSERQPFFQIAMMNDEHLAVVDDKYGDREINFLVNVSHVGFRMRNIFHDVLIASLASQRLAVLGGAWQ